MLIKMRCEIGELGSSVPSSVILQNVCMTVLVVLAFVGTKTTYDNLRKRWSRITVVVIGAGPIGLTSVLIAAKSGKASRIILYEDRGRNDLVNRTHQLAFENRSVHFLRSLGVDFDNIEGCWHNRCFFSRLGVFQEYLLSIINKLRYTLQIPIEIKLKNKFNKDSLKYLDTIPGRVLVVVSDGGSGQSARLLGLSDEFVHQSCKAYGAVAAVERTDQRQVPTPETRIHGIYFDLVAYGNDLQEEEYPAAFHLKLFGSLRNRYMSLAVPKCEAKLVKMLKVVLDQSIMRNIFQACFNAYKNDSESPLTDQAALKSLKFSPRLFEIKLSQRMESTMYIEDANVFVTTEGESARFLNFHSGMDINLGLRGLHSLEQFIKMAAGAETERTVMNALKFKYDHSRKVAQQFIKTGLQDTMFT